MPNISFCFYTAHFQTMRGDIVYKSNQFRRHRVQERSMYRSSSFKPPPTVQDVISGLAFDQIISGWEHEQSIPGENMLDVQTLVTNEVTKNLGKNFSVEIRAYSKPAKKEIIIKPPNEEPFRVPEGTKQKLFKGFKWSFIKHDNIWIFAMFPQGNTSTLQLLASILQLYVAKN